jgi:hypothetical protein
MGIIANREAPDYAKLSFGYGNTVYEFEQALCTVTRKKNIVKTNIQGLDGSRKEVTGADDFQITITGVICGENGMYPQDKVNALHKFLELKDATNPIDVVSAFLNNIFGIYSIQIEDYNLPQTAGSISKQEFTINAISDRPVQLNIS